MIVFLDFSIFRICGKSNFVYPVICLVRNFFLIDFFQSIFLLIYKDREIFLFDKIFDWKVLGQDHFWKFISFGLG